MAGEDTARSLTDWLRWPARQPATPGGTSTVSAEPDRVFFCRALPKFLTALTRHPAPALVDLGPVVGSNISFLGTRLGCKIFVEDCYAEVARLAREKRLEALSASIEARFTRPEASVDGVLCWDLFDFLDREAAYVLARRLVAVLRPGGANFGFFGTVDAPYDRFTKFVIIDEARLRHRPYPAPPGRRRVMQNRDIIKMFDGLVVAESLLLKANTREILFQKP